MKKFSRVNQRLIVIISVILISLIVWFTFNFYNNSDGEVYSSKAALCMEFVQSYLRTIHKTENITDDGTRKWQAAIAIESDMYTMCLLNLDDVSLESYRSSNIEDYLKIAHK